MRYLVKATPAVIFWIFFSVVIFQVPYPESLIKADFVQISFFFLSLYLALLFSLNIFLRNLPSSASISLGIISLLILKALDTLNLITTILVIASIMLLVNYFKKSKSGSLTSTQKIPKLTRLRKRK